MKLDHNENGIRYEMDLSALPAATIAIILIVMTPLILKTSAGKDQVCIAILIAIGLAMLFYIVGEGLKVNATNQRNYASKKFREGQRSRGRGDFAP